MLSFKRWLRNKTKVLRGIYSELVEGIPNTEFEKIMIFVLF